MQQARDVESICDELTLEQLMERYQAADAQATAEFIDKLSPQLMRFFLMQASSRRDADDLFQDTWLRIHRVRHTYRRGSPVLPWVFSIARHTRVDGFRKRFRIERNETVPEVLPEKAHLEPASHTQLPEFEVLMAELPESQREIVTMLKVNGLSLEEVAGITSSTVGAVKQKASRAYAKLRLVLEERRR